MIITTTEKTPNKETATMNIHPKVESLKYHPDPVIKL